MQNWEETVISQYGNSPVLLGLISNFNAYIDPSTNITAFYNDMWNIATATGYGLDVWGRIVGVNRVLQVSQSRYLGFVQQTTLSVDPFDTSPWYSGEPLLSGYGMSDPQFQTLILAKAMANISNGSVPVINAIMGFLFAGRGNAYVQDPGSMTLIYTLDFAATNVDLAMIYQTGVLPKPTGVRALYRINGTMVPDIAPQLFIVGSSIVPGPNVISQ